MKKHLLSLGLVAASTMASAQPSVTLGVIVDAALKHGSGSTSRFNGLGSGGNSTSRWWLRGDEDLGGGLRAGFWLESGVQLDSGGGNPTNTNNQTTGVTPTNSGLTFDRRSTVSLISQTAGELRLGRDYSVQNLNHWVYDPFWGNGVGAAQTSAGSPGGPVHSRVSNAIMYFLPEIIGEFYGEAQYYLGENPSNAGAIAHAGDGGGVRFGYKTGRFDVAFAIARTQYAQTAVAGDIGSWNIGARWNLDPRVAIMGAYFQDKIHAVTPITGRGWQVGGVWSVGVGDIKYLVSRYGWDTSGNPETTKLSLGYVHNLSKRTAIYSTWARLRNSGGATMALNSSVTGPNRGSSGFDVGVKTSF